MEKKNSIVSRLVEVIIVAIFIMAVAIRSNATNVPANSQNPDSEKTSTVQQEKDWQEQVMDERQKIFNLLMDSHSYGSNWLSPDGKSLEQIQKWLQNDTPEEEFEQTSFYNLHDGYAICVTPIRTLALYNQEGWKLESYNVDIPLALEEKYDSIATGSGATYVLENEKLVEFTFGEKRTIDKLPFEPKCIWSTTSKDDFQFVFVQQGGNLGFIYDGKFKMIANDYCYGIECYYADSDTMAFSYANQSEQRTLTFVKLNSAEHTDTVYVAVD